MTEVVPVLLPRGLWRDEAHLRHAVIRPVTGADEEALAAAAGESTAARVSFLLGRCLVSLEGTPLEGKVVARRLSVGDRDALLLHLRRISIGDTMDCVLACPAERCGEALDFPLRIEDLILPLLEEPEPIHETVLEIEGEPWTVRFRVPTGTDQEDAVAWMSDEGPQVAAARLADRCVQRASGPGAVDANRLPDFLLEGLSEALAAAEPQADLVLRLTCPECGEHFATRFDVASYFLAELVPDHDRLHRHVHLLALHYHWSESEILSLTPRKRRLYLDLLSEHGGGPVGVGNAA